ncbi:MAG TPA: toll/interleukin-1 receptor domain-containing protein [Longimicrobium sp.]|nr:toll/interleukin-1 receptor domain-containing protein [Longimicrobium sp.]
MTTGLFNRPLAAARVFLSHSWDDNDLTDFLARRLDRHFSVTYDRAAMIGLRQAPPVLPGDPLVPHPTILGSDLFLFAASPHSFAPGSYARDELARAEAPRSTARPRIVMIALDGYAIPDGAIWGMHLELRGETREHDCKRITRSLRILLMQMGGLYEARPLARERTRVVLGGEKPEAILDALTSAHGRGIYTLNAVLPAKEMDDAVNAVRAAGARDAVGDRLLEIYLQERNRAEFTVARQNAIILLSRVFPGEATIIREVTRRRPDVDTSFLYRGFQVALGLLGDEQAILHYALCLESREEEEWEEQRKLNLGFHLRYYGGMEPTLHVLRESCRACTPAYLLPLNVYTLSVLSSWPNDADLLLEREEHLVAHGVPRQLVQRAVHRIRKFRRRHR